MAFLVDRLIPVVEAMTENHEGRRDLAAVCAAYLEEHRPETSVGDNVAEVESPVQDTPDKSSRPPQRDGQRSNGRRRRRRGR